MPHIAQITSVGIPATPFVQRPNVLAYDWNVGDFIKDQTFRDLNCSGIVPAGATWIVFNGEFRHTLDNQNFDLRRKSTGTTWIGPHIYTHGAIYLYQTLFCQTDPDRIIQYRASNNATWNNLNLVVIGWFL